MNAKESRKIADKVNVEKHKTQKEDVYALIKSTRITGAYKCRWYDNLIDAVINDLKSDGYIVERALHRNEITITIKW